MSDLASAKLEASLAETCAQVQSLCTEETEESDAILKIAPIKSNLQPDAVAMTIPMPPTFPSPFAHRHHIKRTLAAAFRVFSQNGFDEAVAGHITARDPISPTHFWVNPFGMHFACIRASDLILVDSSAHVVAGGKEGNRIVNTTAFMIHSNIHERRKDVNCAAHAHTIYGRTWASTGRPLEMITQDACAFYKDHVVYDRFGGVILGQGEGRMIADALGNHKVHE